MKEKHKIFNTGDIGRNKNKKRLWNEIERDRQTPKKGEITKKKRGERERDFGTGDTPDHDRMKTS